MRLKGRGEGPQLGLGYVALSSFLSVCLLSGCSTMSDSPLTDFGNKVLGLVGYLPGKAVFDSVGSMTNATKSMSREEEYFLGRSVAANLLEQDSSGAEAELTEQLQAYVRQVGATVVAFADETETFGGYHFGILNTDEPNAMAAPGGFIFVTRGLLRLMTSEDVLAAVLAHEISHVINHDGVNSIRQDALVEVLKGAGELAGTLTCNQVLQQATVVFGGAVKEVTGTLLLRGYDKDQEFAADRAAVLILARAGYEPYALVDFLEVLERAQNYEKDGWFKTHPSPTTRKEKLVEFLTEQGVVRQNNRVGARERRFKGAVTW